MSDIIKIAIGAGIGSFFGCGAVLVIYAVYAVMYNRRLHKATLKAMERKEAPE